MKSICLIYALFLGLTTVKAQGYESIFGDSSTQWNIAEDYVDAAFTAEYVVSDTVLFNTLAYRKILRGPFATSLAIRQDTLTGRVWIYNEVDNQEFLVSDMSLEVGDSILLGLSNSYITADSVYYQANRKHIRFNRSIWHQTEKLEFIEGIGPNTGFPLGYSGATKLICAHKDGNLIFSDSSMFNNGPCMYSVTAVAENISNKEIKVYPNPSSDLITFAIDNYLNERVTITILDRLGRTVQEVTSTLTNPVVNTAEIAAGIYFYRLAANGKPLGSGKISVSN